MPGKLVFALLWMLSISVSQGQDRIIGKHFTTRAEILAQNGMAATSHPLATQIAIDILKRGGSAVDAAIAANAALGLMEPTGSGIGGDIFAIVYEAETGKLHGLNGSGRSPKSLTLDFFREKGMNSIPAYGPLPVSVPGCVDGWFALHGRFGKLSMQEVLNPAIHYAEQGFPLTELIAFYWNLSARRFRDYPNFSNTFMRDGKAPAKGEIFKNPALANTYKKIAAGGRDAFYEGEIAEVITSHVQELGGFLSLEDLSTHHSEWVEPVSVNYRGYDVFELPPNGQGIAALQILKILESYDLKAMGFGSAEYIHHFVEAKKLAFADRARFYADPQFADVPVEWLISEEYASERRKLLDPERAARSVDPGNLNHGETIYLTVADSQGNMVSLIQSNYRGMGSGVTPPGLGFMLQDRGELFSLEDGHPNIYAPGKRPFHTIIPAFVMKDGEPWLSFGVMGGAMQPQGHAQILINLIDFDMNLQEAGDAPRIMHEGSSQPTGEIMTDGGTLNLETGIDLDVLRKLYMLGHHIQFSSGGYGGYQAIQYNKTEDVYIGASESRKDGQASGY